MTTEMVQREPCNIGFTSKIRLVLCTSKSNKVNTLQNFLFRVDIDHVIELQVSMWSSTITVPKHFTQSITTIKKIILH